MKSYFAEITRDIYEHQLWAQRSYRRAVWARGYDRVIHKQAARFCIEKARALRIERAEAVAVKTRKLLAA